MRVTLPEDTPTPETPSQETTPHIAEDCLDISGYSRLDKLKYRFRQEREKWKEMNRSERLSYFMDYYKWPTIFTVMGIVCLIILGYNLYQNSFPTDLRIAILNADTEILEEDAFLTAYRTHYEIPEAHKLEVYPNFKIDPETYQQELNVAGSSQITVYEQLSAYIMSNYFDAMITDPKGYEYSMEIGLIYSLTNIFSEETLKQVEDDLVYYTNTDGETVPMVLDISDWEVVSQLNLSYDTVYLAFPCNTKSNLEHAVQLLEYMLSLEH